MAKKKTKASDEKIAIGAVDGAATALFTPKPSMVISDNTIQTGPSQVDPLPTEATVALAGMLTRFADAVIEVAHAARGPEVTVRGATGISLKDVRPAGSGER